MPIFFQQEIDNDTRLAIWKIEEGEDFFLQKALPALPLEKFPYWRMVKWKKK